MNELYDLKEMLCKELEDYGRKGELTAGSLDVVDKLAHTIKNIDKILEADDPQYSQTGRMMGNSYGMGNMGGYNSYARGRRRDSMGRYSSEGYSRGGDMMDRLTDLMNDAPDDRTRQEIQRLMDKMR